MNIILADKKYDFILKHLSTHESMLPVLPDDVCEHIRTFLTTPAWTSCTPCGVIHMYLHPYDISLNIKYLKIDSGNALCTCPGLNKITAAHRKTEL
jgi:hypothetical protein